MKYFKGDGGQLFKPGWKNHAKVCWSVFPLLTPFYSGTYSIDSGTDSIGTGTGGTGIGTGGTGTDNTGTGSLGLTVLALELTLVLASTDTDAYRTGTGTNNSIHWHPWMLDGWVSANAHPPKIVLEFFFFCLLNWRGFISGKVNCRWAVHFNPIQGGPFGRF